MFVCMNTQSEMQEARRILSEFQQQQLIAQKLRSLKAKEEELGRREAQLQEKEQRLLEWETSLEKVGFFTLAISYCCVLQLFISLFFIS